MINCLAPQLLRVVFDQYSSQVIWLGTARQAVSRKNGWMIHEYLPRSAVLRGWEIIKLLYP